MSRGKPEKANNQGKHSHRGRRGTKKAVHHAYKKAKLFEAAPILSPVMRCQAAAKSSPDHKEIERRLDEASWSSRDDEARKITDSLSREEIRNLPPTTRKRLKDELNSGWVSDDDKAALRKMWQAENEKAINEAVGGQKALLEARKADLKRWDDATKKEFKKLFGKDDEASRKAIADRIDKEIALNERLSVDNFSPADPPKANRFAYVYPKDKGHTIYLDGAFDAAPATGMDSKAGTLTHEMSHFTDIGGTEDHVYGSAKSMTLAKTDPEMALENADNFEYFIEKIP